jgi:RecA/RadA recombinase
MTVDTSKYSEIVNRINRKYENSLHMGNEFFKTNAISTGSPELDVAMGGGVPQGRWTRFYGGFGSTKTMTAYSVMAEAQAMGLSVAYYNVEKRYEGDFAERKGIDTSSLTVVEGTSVEEIGDKMEALLSVIHLHVIDSCSIAVSEDELNADIRDWRPGINARAWGKVFRRLNERFDPTENTAILIDQVRVNFKTGSEDPAGGKVFDHQSSMSVLFKKSGWLYRTNDGILEPKTTANKGVDGQSTPAGQEIKIRVEKSSVCRPFRTATLRYDLDSLEYDRVYEFMKAAKHYKVVEQHGAYWWYTDEDGSVTKLHGDPGLREFIKDNGELQNYIHDIALDSAREQ